MGLPEASVARRGQLLDPLLYEMAEGAVVVERIRQDRKWGRQRMTRERWLAVLTEEVGEVAEAILEGRDHGVRRELIQVAAVAVAALEQEYEG